MPRDKRLTIVLKTKEEEEIARIFHSYCIRQDSDMRKTLLDLMDGFNQIQAQKDAELKRLERISQRG